MIARTAVGLCVAARWMGAASLALAVAAFAHPSEGGTASTLLRSAIVFAAGVQAYLAFRIELDRVLFEAMPDDGAGLQRLDAALAATGLARSPAGRSLEQRVGSLLRFVIGSGAIVAAQLAMAIAAMWAER